jgi:sortase A
MAASWMSGAFRWTERILLVVGAVCLTSVYGAWKHAAFEQLRAKAVLEQLRAAVRPLPDTRRREMSTASPIEGSVIGVLEIPRLRMSVAVLEGDSERALGIAVGHLPDTPMPWDEGNTALSGHRDTFFRPLKDVRPGDEIRLATGQGRFAYRVRKLMVVGAEDVWVLRPADGVNLTLITCFPFGYLGSAPQRFVVQAERVMRENES